MPEYLPPSELPDPETWPAWRAKPIVIRALRICKDLEISTAEGTMRAKAGDYIARGTRGEFYPIMPAVMADKYDPVDEAN